MIILEGMDGSGKTNLVKRLATDLKLPIRERASRSREGPVKNLWEWVVHDMDTLETQPMSIYDRHPLVSEYIYGPITRAKLPDGFENPGDLITKFWEYNFVILCNPGLRQITENVNRSWDLQMDGVAAHTRTLYMAYQAYFATYPVPFAKWDYTSPNGYADLLRKCRRHVDAS